MVSFDVFFVMRILGNAPVLAQAFPVAEPEFANVQQMSPDGVQLPPRCDYVMLGRR